MGTVQELEPLFVVVNGAIGAMRKAHEANPNGGDFGAILSQ